jgi:hypothetical protein
MADAALADSVNRYLRRFDALVRELGKDALARASSPADRQILEARYSIPDEAGGETWRWQTRQLRRTIAWYIANEPFGIVAGKRQFGHVREVTFEGYAGSPEAGFRDEIERARHIGQLMDVIEMYEHVEAGGSLGGRRGERLTKDFRTFANATFQGKIADESRVRGMLKSVARTLYAGVVNDCSFDPDKALCLRQSSKREAPLLARCNWSKCSNACVAPKHRPMLERALQDAVTYSKTRRLSGPQRVALDDQIALYKDALETIA